MFATYRVNSVLNVLRCKGHLVNIELLIIQRAHLIVIHLFPAQNLDSFLLQSFLLHTFGSAHFFFDFHQLLVAVVQLGLDYFTSFIQLEK